MWKRYDFIKSSHTWAMNCYRTTCQFRSNTFRDSNLKIETMGWNPNCFGPVVIKNTFDIGYSTCGWRAVTYVSNGIRYKNWSTIIFIKYLHLSCTVTEIHAATAEWSFAIINASYLFIPLLHVNARHLHYWLIAIIS